MIPFSNTLSYITGFLFPAYASYKALKTQKKQDDKQWLTYWTIYAMLRIVELILMPQYWSAYYYDLRLLFVIWLQYRQFNGAEWLFDSLVRPFFDEYEDRIDENLDHIKANAVTVMKEKATVVGAHALKIWQREDVQRTVRSGISRIVASSMSAATATTPNGETMTTVTLEEVSSVTAAEKPEDDSSSAAAVEENLASDEHQEEEDRSTIRRRVKSLRKAFEPISNLTETEQAEAAEEELSKKDK